PAKEAVRPLATAAGRRTTFRWQAFLAPNGESTTAVMQTYLPGRTRVGLNRLRQFAYNSACCTIPTPANYDRDDSGRAGSLKPAHSCVSGGAIGRNDFGVRSLVLGGLCRQSGPLRGQQSPVPVFRFCVVPRRYGARAGADR